MMSRVFLLFLVVLLVGWCHGQDSSAFVYPCGVSGIQLDCVRAFMYRYISCTPSYHPDGQPVYMPRRVTYIPSLNLTVISSDVQVTYRDPQVVAFYLNMVTNIIVMAVDFTSIEIYSRNVQLQIAKRKAEPKTVRDYARGTFAPELTANIKYHPERDISVDDITVSAYHKQPFPCFDIGPNFTQSTDSEMQRVLQLLLNDETTVVQELSLTAAYYDFYGFVNAYLCRFSFKYNGAVNRP